MARSLVLERAVVGRGGFQFLRLHELADGFHEIVLNAVIAVVANGEHSRLRAHVAHVGGVEFFGNLGDRLVIDFTLFVQLLRVNFQNLHATLLVRKRDFNLSVETTRAHQRRVQHIGSVRRHDHLDLAKNVETIELIQKFHECTLNLAIGRRAFGKALATDGVDFVHEDDARLVVPSVTEHLSDQSRGLADILIHYSARNNLQKVCVDVTRDRLGEERLPRPWRSVEQYALRRRDAHAHKKFGIHQRQLDRLSKRSNLLPEPTDRAIVHVPRGLAEHVKH
mmetsp:Transcript_2427/g.9507  ORF Transcript_2427/g.9507 Transcript_2427/m.9507 type:complete len:280 (+) Transcript_2427:55-894(+)